MECRCAGYFIFDHLNNGGFAVASVKLIKLLEDCDPSGCDGVDQTYPVRVAEEQQNGHDFGCASTMDVQTKNYISSSATHFPRIRPQCIRSITRAPLSLRYRSTRATAKQSLQLDPFRAVFRWVLAYSSNRNFDVLSR